MKYNKVYMPKDAIARHEDFDTWYEDGEIFMRFESKGSWESEKTPVRVIGRLGGQNALIKPDNRALNYYLQHERYEYTMHALVINKHYFIEGMVWDMYGSFQEPPFDILEETLTSFDHKAVHVRLKEFKNKGECYEIHVSDLTKLRIGVISVVAIGIKEEWKGLSEGEDAKDFTWWEKVKRGISATKGLTYEQVEYLEAIDSPLVRIIRPKGRPIDYRKKR